MNVIRQAMQVIEDRGMAKSIVQDEEGHVCVGGAVSLACDGNAFWWGSTDFGRAIGLIDRVAAEQYPERAICGDERWAAVRFNNHPDTTQTQLLRVMDKAAVLWDEGV